MKSVSKIIGLLLVGILVLLLVAGLAITQLFDPNDYKDEIRHLVRDKAGLELTLDGEIGWSLFPWLGLEVKDVQVARPQTPQQPFAKVRLLALSVRVLPLLKKEVQMSAVRIDGLELELKKDARGDSNWQETASAGQSRPDDDGNKQQTAGQNVPADKASAPAMPIRLDVDSLIVNSARLNFVDEQSNQQFTLENVQITTGRISEATDINIKLSGFLANSQPLLRARVEMSGLAMFDLQRQLFILKELRMAGELAGEPLDSKTASFTLRGNLQADLQQQTASASNLRLGINQLKLLADLDASDLDKQAKITGKLSVAQVSLKEFLPGIGIALPAMQDSKALGTFSLAGDLRADENSFSLSGLAIKLDETSFGGTLGSKNLAAGHFYASLQGDRLDLDAYMPPARQPEGKQQPGTAKDTAAVHDGDPIEAPLPGLPEENPWSSEPLLPLEQLRQLALDLELQMQELKIQRLPLHQLQLKLDAGKGVLRLARLSADLFAGQLDINAKLDAGKPQPALEFAGKVNSVPVQEIIRALELEVPLSGLLNLDTQLRSSGNSERELVAALNGKGSFKVVEGQLEGINVDHYLCSAIAVLNRKTMTNKISRADTSFTALAGSYQVKNGVLENNDLSVAVPGLHNTGKGRLDLNVLGLDYAIGARLLGDTRPMPDPACSINERYVGLEFPLVCRGSLTPQGALSCKVDGDGLGKIVARLAGDKLTDKLDEKLGEKVSPDLKKALKGLFK